MQSWHLKGERGIKNIIKPHYTLPIIFRCLIFIFFYPFSCLLLFCLRNIDVLWCKHFLDYFYKTSHWKYVIGPFESILPSLAQVTVAREDIIKHTFCATIFLTLSKVKPILNVFNSGASGKKQQNRTY